MQELVHGLGRVRAMWVDHVAGELRAGELLPAGVDGHNVAMVASFLPDRVEMLEKILDFAIELDGDALAPGSGCFSQLPERER